MDVLARSGFEPVARGAAGGLERGIAAADPLDPGVDAPVEPWARDVLAGSRSSGAGRRSTCRVPLLSLGARAAAAAALEAELEAAAPATVKVEDVDLARYLEREGRLVRLGDGHAVSAGLQRARAIVVEECEAAGRIALARFRDLAGCGRRDAQLLLERLDSDGVTRRVGDERVLRRSASRSA